MAAGERAPVRRRLRIGAGLFGLMLASTAGLALFGTLSGFFLPNYFLSNYTQHHGILDSGTISNVTNSRTEKGSWWATVQITLDRPVDGATSTTLTVRNAVNSPDGTSVTVLVDPQDPAHAEYPGRPTNPAWVPIMFLCFTGVSALLFIFVVWQLAVIRFRNRGLPPPPAGRHVNQRGTRARSRVGGLPAIGDRGAGPDAVGGGTAADGRKLPRQWVVAPEAEEGVAALAEMVARSPRRRWSWARCFGRQRRCRCWRHWTLSRSRTPCWAGRSSATGCPAMRTGSRRPRRRTGARQTGGKAEDFLLKVEHDKKAHDGDHGALGIVNTGAPPRT